MQRSRNSTRSEHTANSTTLHHPGPHSPSSTSTEPGRVPSNSPTSSSFLHMHRHSQSAAAAISSGNSLSVRRRGRSGSRPNSPAPIDTSVGESSRGPSRLLPFMRRPQSSRRASERASSSEGMFSTVAERLSTTQRRPHSPDRTKRPPSISQIAMGLHTSRTPHLRPPTRRINSEPAQQQRPHSASSSRSGAPPPFRSSLKKTASLTSGPSRSTSPSASTSSVPRTPRPHSALSRLSLAISSRSGSSRVRLERFLKLGGRDTSNSNFSLQDDSDPEAETPKKSVRFSSITEDGASEKGGMVVVIGPSDES